MQQQQQLSFVSDSFAVPELGVIHDRTELNQNAILSSRLHAVHTASLVTHKHSASPGELQRNFIVYPNA
jgi:hypothetical protein